MWELCGPENIRSEKSAKHVEFWKIAARKRPNCGREILKFLKKEGFG